MTRLASTVGMVTGVTLGTTLVLAPGPAWTTVVGWSIAAWALCFSAAEMLFILPAAVRSYSIQVFDADLVVRRGGIMQRIDRIPISKVTTIRSRTGPLLRRFHLTSCTIVTASAEIAMPAIAAEDARLLAEVGSSL